MGSLSKSPSSAPASAATPDAATWATRSAVARLTHLFGPDETLLVMDDSLRDLPSNGTYGALLAWLPGRQPTPRALAALLHEARPLLRSDAVVAVASHGPMLGVRRALRHAGYGTVSAYTIDPSLYNPATLLPQRGPLAWLAWLRSARLLLAARAGRPTLPVIAALPLLAGPGVIIERLRCSEKDKTLVLARVQDQPIVLRLPHTAAALAAETHACATLTQLHACERLSPLLPRPRPLDGSDTAPAFVESRVEGRSLAQVLVQGMRAALAPEVDRVLELLNPAADGRDGAAHTLYDGYAKPLLARLSHDLGQPAWSAPLASALEAELRGVTCRMGLVHGDFSVSNVFVSRGCISGLIDWENTQWQAPPLLDAMNYLDSVERRCRKVSLLDTIPLLASGAWPVLEEASLLRRAFERSGADWRHRKAYAMLYGLSHVTPQLKFAAPGDPVCSRVEHLVRWYLGSTG
jgi:aminoglycoside phosphotransferase (APT) family kinase protein